MIEFSRQPTEEVADPLFLAKPLCFWGEKPTALLLPLVAFTGKFLNSFSSSAGIFVESFSCSGTSESDSLPSSWMTDNFSPPRLFRFPLIIDNSIGSNTPANENHN